MEAEAFGMLNALSVCLDADLHGAKRAELSLVRQGFKEAYRRQWRGGLFQAWSSSMKSGSQNGKDERDPENERVVHSGAGTACCLGPLWYRGRYGRRALSSLLDEIDSPDGLDESQLRGSFAIFLQKGDRGWLLNDPLGLIRVYCSADFKFHCTSWLATRAYTGDASIDEAAAAEYVLLGAVHDERTVGGSVRKLALGQGIDLAGRGNYSRFPGGLIPPSLEYDLEAAVLDVLAPHLRTVFGEIAAAFPDRISMALSGGFDSRLILAGLMARGVRPRMFVYGHAESADVRIARAVAVAEGLELETVDKDELAQDLPAPNLEVLLENALFFDGLPNDGILDPGTDRLTRLAQSSGGRLALNGGGGEIFRNFFHLPDRRFDARDVVRCFYRSFDRNVFRNTRTLAHYEERLVLSITRAIAAAGQQHSTHRAVVELIYPLFRCHHWMGLNNSVAVRHGLFHTPLVDLQTARIAHRIPLKWKNAGLLQSRLITALHHDVASHKSAYGFAFSDGPHRRARFLDWSTRLRPAMARPLINSVRRLSQGRHVSPVLLARCRLMLTGEWCLDHALDLRLLPDDAALSRAMAVEVSARNLAG